MTNLTPRLEEYPILLDYLQFSLHHAKMKVVLLLLLCITATTMGTPLWLESISEGLYSIKKALAGLVAEGIVQAGGLVKINNNNTLLHQILNNHTAFNDNQA